jgi:hypothetical protein
MGFDGRQSAIMQQHLAQKNLVCPVCSNRAFQLVDVTAIPVKGLGMLEHPNARKLLKNVLHEPTGAPTFTGPAAFAKTEEPNRVFPVAIISCTNCFYIMQFSWMPILDQANRG